MPKSKKLKKLSFCSREKKTFLSLFSLLVIAIKYQKHNYNNWVF